MWSVANKFLPRVSKVKNGTFCAVRGRSWAFTALKPVWRGLVALQRKGPYDVCPSRRSGEIGIRTRLKIWRPSRTCRFESDLRQISFPFSNHFLPISVKGFLQFSEENANFWKNLGMRLPRFPLDPWSSGFRIKVSRNYVLCGTPVVLEL
jgi:hypothetical protein